MANENTETARLSRRDLAMLRAHACNTLSVIPEHVDANDKLRLVDEVFRLRIALQDIASQEETELALDPDWARRVAQEALGND